MYDKNYLEKHFVRRKGRRLQTLKDEYRRIYELLGGKKILDAGCGDGFFLKHAPKDIEVWGVDINSAAIDKLKNEGLNVKHSSVTKLPFKDREFEGIYCNLVIEHLCAEEASKMFKEFNRVLKANGRVIVITDTEKVVWGGPTHVRPYTLLAIRILFHLFEFEEVKHEYVFRHSKILEFLPKPLYYFARRFIGTFNPWFLMVVGKKKA